MKATLHHLAVETDEASKWAGYASVLILALMCACLWWALHSRMVGMICFGGVAIGLVYIGVKLHVAGESLRRVAKQLEELADEP